VVCAWRKSTRRKVSRIGTTLEGIQASRRDLVQHRREQKEVLRVDEQHFHARIARHPPLELERGIDAREAGPEDHDACHIEFL
jgi:hypothetical protein